MTEDGRPGEPVVRGFPHLGTVRDSITALYRRMGGAGVRAFAGSLPAAEVAFGDAEELYGGAQRVARAAVTHLRLPDARMIVGFRRMEHAATVELTSGPEYFVELNDRFRSNRRDVGAALVHEATHVLLHRMGLEFSGTRENEILTDTVAVYLGAGWLLLDAFREDALTRQKLGYLTPEEFGYVLAKRSLAFGEDPSPWFTSPRAYQAYTEGRSRALRDLRVPPLRAAGGMSRMRYARDRHRAVAAPGAPYAFEGGGPERRVLFDCPTCHQRLRVPVRGPVRARCGVCGTQWACDT
ncbi:hypothetical protein ACWCPT_25915 [Streptomyces sp. NPDC002308]